jgi:hypothetical protein
MDWIDLNEVIYLGYAKWPAVMQGAGDPSQDRLLCHGSVAEDEARRHLIFDASCEVHPHWAATLSHRLSLGPRLINGGLYSFGWSRTCFLGFYRHIQHFYIEVSFLQPMQ